MLWTYWNVGLLRFFLLTSNLITRIQSKEFIAILQLILFLVFFIPPLNLIALLNLRIDEVQEFAFRILLTNIHFQLNVNQYRSENDLSESESQ